MALFTATINATISPKTGLLANQIVGATINASITPAGVVNSMPIHSISGAITPAGSVAAHRVRVAIINALITPAGGLNKKLVHSLPGQISPSGALQKKITTNLAASIAPVTFINAAIGEAPCNIPLSDLEERCWKLLDDDGTYYPEPTVRKALNAGQNLFCFLTLCLETTVDFPLTNGQAWYQVSTQISNYLMPLRVSFNGARLRMDTIHQLEVENGSWRSTPGNPIAYAQLGFDLLAVTPQPASGSNALAFTYAREPVQMVNQTDVPEIPPEQQVDLPYFAYFWLQLKVGGLELQRAAEYLQKWLGGAQKYAQFVRAKSKAQLYDVMPFDLASFDHGRLAVELASDRSRKKSQQYDSGRDKKAEDKDSM